MSKIWPMEVILITSPGKSEDELTRVIRLFQTGLQTLHVRKPKFSTREVEEFILSIPEEYRSRIVVHGHYHLAIRHNLKGVHLHRRHRDDSWKNRWRRFKLRFRRPTLVMTSTFHSMQSLRENRVKYDYTFLSQVFSAQNSYSLTDPGSMHGLKRVIEQSLCPVVATGGVCQNNMSLVLAAGFAGIGVSSALLKQDVADWESSFQHFQAA